VEVTEIDRVAGSRNARSMFCDAQDVEIFLTGGGHHLLQCAVGVAASYGVGVNVK
jgi:hypothetical protein